MKPQHLIWIGLGVAIAVMLGAVETRGIEFDYRSGYIFGKLLVPALIAYAIAGRKKVRNWQSFSILFLGLATAWSVFSWNGTLASRAKPVTAKTLLQQAVSGHPAPNSTAERIGFELLQKMRDTLKAHMAEAAQCKVDPAPLSVASMENRDAMETTQQSFERCAQIDMDYVGRVKQLSAEVRAKVAESDMSASEQEAFLGGFENSSQGTLRMIENEEKVEGAFIDSVRDLYSFSMEHANQIKTKRNQIVIADPVVLAGYNQRFRRAQSMATNFEKIQKQDQANSAQKLNEIGITIKDLQVK